ALHWARDPSEPRFVSSRRTRNASRLTPRAGFPGPAPLAFRSGHDSLSLPQALLLVAHERRQQILDDAPLSGLDLDRHRHAGRKVDHAAFDLHAHGVERDARRVEELLAGRFAGAR